jgi:hypothetical protein
VELIIRPQESLAIYKAFNGCRVDVSLTDVSPTESSWMLRPLNKLSLGYYAPDRSVPTLDHVTHGSHKAGSTAAIRLSIGYR